MDKEYQKHIVSTPEVVTLLHRCSIQAAQKIVREGLNTRSGDIHSTANTQSRNIEEAENQFRSGSGYGPAVVIIQIPSKLYALVKQETSVFDMALDSRIRFSEGGEIGKIRTDFIVGWIDRDTDTFYKK